MADKAKLIVLAAFDRNDEGELVPAFDPRQVATEALESETLSRAAP